MFLATGCSITVGNVDMKALWGRRRQEKVAFFPYRTDVYYCWRTTAKESIVCTMIVNSVKGEREVVHTFKGEIE